jgi:hypothetical protein
LNGHEASFPPLCLIATADSQNVFSLIVIFVMVIYVSADMLGVPQQHQPRLGQQIVTVLLGQTAFVARRPNHLAAGQNNQIAVQTAKERLEAFRLFESLSNPGKGRMKAIIGSFLLIKFRKHNFLA